MIYFFADDHFGKHPGQVIYENIKKDVPSDIRFYENDLSMLESGEWLKDCDLLILHLIGTTCGLPHAGPGAEKAVRQYCEHGGNVLLLHGSSAAFWQWQWWREIVGLRWVRPGDPDSQVSSVHPHTPCHIQRVKSRHPLVNRLREFDLPNDEVYTALEETAPVMNFLETTVEGHTWSQACETITPWNGKFVSFIPGHLPECTSNPDLLYDVLQCIQYLMSEKGKAFHQWN